MSRGEKPKDGIWRLSASQLSAWKLCKRKWFYDKIMKLAPDPEARPKYGADIGTEIHGALERYQITGWRLPPGAQIMRVPKYNNPTVFDEYDIGKILIPVWDHELILPHVLDKNVLSEGECNTVIGGVPFVGYIDKRWQVGSTMFIMDYKSTKQWSYTKTQEEAEYDPQTLVYAKWALEQPGIDNVVFYYFNIRYTPPIVPPRYIEVEHTWETIADYLNAADEIVREIAASRNQPEYRFEQNRGACYAYGKCEFAYECWKTTTVKSDEPPKETKMAFDVNALLDKHVKKVQADPNSITNQTEAEKPAPRPAPVQAPAPKPPSSPVVNTPTFKKPAAVPEPAPTMSAPKIERKSLPDTADIPVIYFGSQPMNKEFELLENFLERIGEFARWSEANKGAYYLTSAYNVGERQIAAQFALDVYEGKVALPAHLVVTDNSKIGHYLRLETRYLDQQAVIVGRSAI